MEARKYLGSRKPTVVYFRLSSVSISFSFGVVAHLLSSSLQVLAVGSPLRGNDCRNYRFEENIVSTFLFLRLFRFFIISPGYGVDAPGSMPLISTSYSSDEFVVISSNTLQKLLTKRFLLPMISVWSKKCCTLRSSAIAFYLRLMWFSHFFPYCLRSKDSIR